MWLYTLGRIIQMGGGIILYVRDDIPSKELKLSLSNDKEYIYTLKEETFAGRNFRGKKLSREETFAGRNFRGKKLSWFLVFFALFAKVFSAKFSKMCHP